MDVKLTLVCAVLIVLAAQDLVEAEFLYNRYFPKREELASRGLKCIPGRTVIKTQEKPVEPETSGSDDDSDKNGRRAHMMFTTNDEFCQVCVCSVDGKDEFCSKRPAMNVNECMRMTTLMDRFQKNEPFDHERTLSYMIRRDYIWHDDEIPYDTNAKCKRAHSYYSNSVVANDSFIEAASDINSLLDYTNKSVCFYCVCSAGGDSAGCLSRSPWFCEYYRIAREPNAARDRYRAMFQQDRPAYFRQLSYRLRRTMDDGMFDLIETGGDSLCCGHSDGHRRQMHHQVRNKIRLLKNRINKENLMGGSPGGDYVDFIVNNDLGEDQSGQKCVPFVSKYTDCNEDNKCGECESCTCTANGKWTCETVHECTADQEQELNVADIDSALDSILDEIKQKDNQNDKVMYAPTPLEPEKLIDASEQEYKFRDGSDELKNDPTFLSMLLRDKKVYKRSLTDNNTNKSNETVMFHHTVDEINEDTLKSSNTSGTLEAEKVNMMMSASRRATHVLNNSTSESLQIEYTPPIQNQHVADNRVDTPAIHDDQVDLLVHHKIYEMVGNKSQLTRDKDLSKLLVNELKGGAEIIGDQSSPVISNITFTSENDTITAMAFIAGNLLNKLWNMEKDANDNTMETENLKHKKINDLLELFKEPLNLRQENFLKKALEQLSTAIENKEVERISLCKNLEDIKEASGLTSDKNQTKKIKDGNIILENVTRKSNQVVATVEALGKISNVLDLIKKYEHIQNRLGDLKSNSGNITVLINSGTSSDKDLTKDEKITLNMFGNILESLTKLLIPNKKSKKVINGVKSKNLFIGDEDIGEKNKNLNITGISVTAKDRIVLDYLAHIQNSPNCLFTKQQDKPLPNIEGDILLNLSEFFKIKSMSDLLRLTESGNKKEENIFKTKPRMTEKKYSIDFYTTEKSFQTTEMSKIDKFELTKKKIKVHLKKILEDLAELQNVNGQPKKGKNIEIADALPCIYNLLNGDIATSNTEIKNIQSKKENPRKVTVDPVNKLADIFKNLQKELKRTAQTRRTNIGSGPRPKSAIVWERTIKGLDKLGKTKQKLETRRNLQEEVLPKSLEDINKLIEKIESVNSNTYKSMAYLAEVPAAERLTLLRTLSVDTRKYIKTIIDIKESLAANTNLTPDQHNSIFEFIDNANLNINLNKKIIANLNKPKKSTHLSSQKEKAMKQVPMYKYATETVPSKSIGFKLSRDQIINQLIKNRMQYYLRLKEISGDSKGSINVGLAKNILLYLEIGNYNLARELYKLFVTENKIKNKPMATSSSQAPDPVNYDTLSQQMIGRRITEKVPLIQFEEPKEINKGLSWSDQDRLIKQLMNMKNMKT